MEIENRYTIDGVVCQVVFLDPKYYDGNKFCKIYIDGEKFIISEKVLEKIAKPAP